MKKYILNNMTTLEAKEAIKKSSIVIVPVGSFEQHGPHLPLKTDYTLAYKRACIIAQKTDTVIASVLEMGYSDHHLGFFGTISISNETLINILKDIAKSLSYSGVKKIVILNGHGGNDNALNLAATKIKKEIGVSVAVFGVSDITKYSLKKFDNKFDIHAGVQETAAMYIYEPESVKEELIEKPFLKSFVDPNKVANEYNEETANKMFYVNFEKVKDLSSNGVISYLDPNEAKKFIIERQKIEEQYIEQVVKFILAWKKY